ncbi:MAG TPA: DUF808 family protein, partial [Halioglobus sp.]
ILGGLFLCYEGFEKVAHSFMETAADEAAHNEELVRHLVDTSVDLVQFEQEKIKGAVRTDFILSAEIIVLTLGIVAEMDFVSQVLVLSAISLIMTVGVYGLVAGIVKLDDAGLYLMQQAGQGVWPAFKRWVGARLMEFAPLLMKILSVVGTVAMFMVGGGILAHGIHVLGDGINSLATHAEKIVTVGPVLASMTPTLAGIVIGMCAGAAVLAIVALWQRLRSG